MFDISAGYSVLSVLAVFTLGAWIYGTLRRDVSGVDSLWSLFFLLSLGVYVGSTAVTGPRLSLLWLLVGLWSIRLSVYLTLRNFGQPEDRRYQAIRKRNEPHFWLKSLVLVYLLQAVLAWIISIPVLAAVSGTAALGWLDYAGITLWVIGMIFEVGGDWQLSRFLRRKTDPQAVLDEGFWRYTRHPNYFGEALIWWGFYLMALSAGFWWTIFSPVLMTFLLMRVSGVVLLEKDIAERRPAYADYIRRTRAFFPGPRRSL